jgi:AraC family transcriptional regulator
VPSWLGARLGRDPVTFTNEVIVALVRQLMEADATETRYLRALGNALLAELQHTLGRTPEARRPPATRGGLRISHTAIRHIQGRLGEPLAVRDLAEVCGVGVTHFTRSFRDTTGLTPHRFLRRARIERADELLRTTALSIGEIAEAVGFRGQSHFCTAFVQERGLTPSAHRRACRNASQA